MKRRFSFNINDFNFILTFAGFPIVTSLLPFIPSVPYRAFALLIALICLIKNRGRLKVGPKLFSLFLAIVFLLDIRVLYDLYITQERLYETYSYSINQCALFVIGVVLVPILGVFTGINKINWETTLRILCILLFLVIVTGIRGMDALSEDEMNSIRVSLNDRQSTLAFGDNGGYLVILSFVLMMSLKRVKSKLIRRLFFIFLCACIVVGIYAIAKAASRGPFMSMVVGVIGLFLTLGAKNKMKSILVLIILFFMLGVNTSSLEKFAPVLFNRMTSTIEEGDTSGRDILFSEAWRIIEAHPITGGNPIMLSATQFSTYHNGFLDVGVGLGIIGFILYIWIHLIILKRILCKEYDSKVPLYYFIVGMFFFNLMRSMSGAGLISNPVYAMTIGLACIVLSKQKLII